MNNKKVDVFIAFSFLFTYGITLFLIKYPASYTSGSPVALFWAGVPVIDIGKSFLFLSFALILAYIFTGVRQEFDERHAPILLFVGAFITSLFLWDMPEVNNDYATYFDFAKYIEINGLKDVFPIGAYGSTYFVMPVLDGYLFKLFGEERIIIQILRTTMFSLTAVIIYYIGKKLWNCRVGLVAGTLLFSFPYFLSMSHLMLLDVPLTFFLTFTVFAVIKAHESHKWYIILIAAIFLTLFTKKTGVLYLGFLLPATLLALFARSKWKILKIALPVSAAFVYIALTKFSNFLKESVESLYGQPVEYTSHSIYWINPQYFLKSLPIVIGPIATILAFCSILFLFKKKDYRLLIPVVWMILPLFLMVNPAFRHLMPAYPAYALSAALVLVDFETGISIGKLSFILNRKSWRFLLASTVLLSITTALFIFPQIEATHMQVNVKEAAEYTDELGIQNISLVTISDASFNWHGRERNFRNMYDYFSSANVVHFPVQYFQDTNPDSIVVVSTIINPDIPASLNNTLRNYYLSKIFSKGDYEYFAPAIFSVYLPQIEYHSMYSGFIQKIGKMMVTEVYEVANPNIGLSNFITWTPSDRKILDKNISVTWTIEAGEEPLEVGFYYRMPQGFFADTREEKIPKGSTVEITRIIEPSQNTGTYLRIVPYEAEGREIRITNVTFRSEFYNISISRDMHGFKF